MAPGPSSPPSSQALEALVLKLVPNLARPPTRPNDSASADVEADRQEAVAELVAYTRELLSARLNDPGPSSARELADEARKRLMGSSSSSRSVGMDKAVRFGNLWNRVEYAHLLQAPDAQLHFLLALSALSPTTHDVPPPFIVPAASSRKTAPTLRSLGPSVEPPYSSSRVAASSNLPDGRNKGKERKMPGRDAPDDTTGRPILPQTKEVLLASWRNRERGTRTIPEELILRDALYILQGVDGRFVRFIISPSEPNPYLVRPENETAPQVLVFSRDDELGVVLPPVAALMNQLAEIGWLCRNVERFVAKCQVEAKTGPAGPGSSSGGRVEQSLCHFLQTQLTGYYHLISILENQMLPPPKSSGLQNSPLTLLRLKVWTEETRVNLRLLSSVVDDERNSHGGALVSLIHAYTESGDPSATVLTAAILEEVSKPFFDSLQRWIFHGELHDPYNEFFVCLNPEFADKHFVRRDPFLGAEDAGFSGFDGRSRDLEGVESHLLWEHKFAFRKEMLPSFVSEDFGRKIFSTGKSLNFIRFSCQDSDWIATRARLEGAGRLLKYSDIAGLESSIDAAYDIASKRLLEVFFDKFMLMDHLKALKHYLMLGHGDFIDILMESLAPDLARPANHLYRHTLTAQLEAAVRGSNAQFDPTDVRRRLDARMLPYSHGEIGWDSFVLDYKVDPPIDTILDPKAMEGYQRLFVQLWKLKRVDSALTASWLRLTAGSRSTHRSPETHLEWHQARVVHAEMVHFIRQLQAFYQLEVIECSWEAFEELIVKNEDGLDGLMKAHKEYLRRLVARVLLKAPEGSSDDDLLPLVQDAFQVILEFQSATETLYRYTLEESVRLDSERDSQRGVFTQPGGSSPPLRKDEAELSRIRRLIRDLAAAFRAIMYGIVMGASSHPDPEIKLLGIRCSYNNYYRLARKKDKSAAAAGRKPKA